MGEGVGWRVGGGWDEEGMRRVGGGWEEGGRVRVEVGGACPIIIPIAGC